MEWEPPAEQSFNREWLTPEEALGLLRPVYFEVGTRRRWIMARLKTSQIIAVARTAAWSGQTRQFTPVGQGLWGQCDEWGDNHFWDTGDISLYTRDHRVRFLDVRFDPESFSGKPPKNLLPTFQSQPPEEPQASQSSISDDRPHLSRADAERFCRAILTGWPDVTQDFAHEKATLFFPDKRVPRDRFRSILRSIRGATKPGKKAKTLD
jgi:hypothetical protein